MLTTKQHHLENQLTSSWQPVNCSLTTNILTWLSKVTTRQLQTDSHTTASWQPNLTTNNCRSMCQRLIVNRGMSYDSISLLPYMTLPILTWCYPTLTYHTLPSVAWPYFTYSYLYGMLHYPVVSFVVWAYNIYLQRTSKCMTDWLLINFLLNW